MERLDRLSALVAMTFATAVGIEAWRLDPGTLRNPGPGLMPLIYSAVLVALAAILWARSRHGHAAAFEAPWRAILSVLALLLAWGLAIEALGYALCTLAVVSLLTRGMGATWSRALASGVAVTAVVHVVFVSWLAAPLPRGSLF